MSESPSALPVFSILKLAFKIPAQAPAYFFKKLQIAGLCMVVMDIFVILFWDGSITLFSSFAVFIVYVVFLSLFAITCHRLMLIGDDSVPNYGVLSWSNREWRFLGWSVVAYLVMIAAVLVGSTPYLVSQLVLNLDPIFSKVLTLFAWSIGAYYFSRVSVLLPGCAIDEQMSVKKALNMTKNNGWRLTLVIMAVPAGFGVVFGWLSGQFLLLDMLLAIFGKVIFLYEIVLLSLSFQFLKSQTQGLEGFD